VISSVVASSEEMHKKTGGIVPEVAAREQVRSIIPVVKQAVYDSGLKIQELEAVAVTMGPGLIGSLLVGIETARALAYAWKKPIIPVNHLTAHLYANWVTQKTIPGFPAVGLVVSGGHTDLVLMKSHKKLEWLGGTRDDAAGECFDKCSRLLGLGYPGGPAIAKKVMEGRIKDGEVKIDLPRPLKNSQDYDFSFSGLKTAVARQVAKVANVSEVSGALADEIQEAIVEVLVAKVVRAVEEFRPKSVLLGGGVAANLRLSELLNKKLKAQKVKLFIPPPELCVDNAIMIAAAAFYRGKMKKWEKVKVNPGLEIV
jgi:N6-L-threonylcarbamoyladenine synthase